MAAAAMGRTRDGGRRTARWRRAAVLIAVGAMFLGVGPFGAGLAVDVAFADDANSLWSGASLFVDRKARNVGDLVTLIIVEQTEATQTASTRTGRSGSVQIGPWQGIGESWPWFGGGASDDLQAGGSTRRGGALRAQMTAKVVEVLPNGNLRIEGRQAISVNAEEQELIVSGIVREADIAPNNTVLSTYLADARIDFKGSGALGDKQKPGVLTTIFRFLF